MERISREEGQNTEDMEEQRNSETERVNGGTGGQGRARIMGKDKH